MVPLRRITRAQAPSGPAGPVNYSSGEGVNRAADRTPLLRRLERKRRLFQRLMQSQSLPPELFIRLTRSSFCLEGLPVTEPEVVTAVAGAQDRRSLRPPQALRIRNHVAILRAIEKNVRAGQQLTARAVLRWYTSISCGLSIAAVDGARYERLEQCLRRMNSPQARIQQAVADAASLHAQLLADPLFPGFNGIVARLMLQYHLARCELPPVVFDADRDRTPLADGAFASRLLDLVTESHEWLLHRK